MQMAAWWWLLAVLARGSATHDVVVTVNILRPVTQTSDKFFGISTSPRQILNNDHYSAATVNLLLALSPGYLRVGGPESENLAFKTLTNTSSTFLLTESQWVNLNQLAADTGLHLVFSLGPRSQGLDQLLSFSDNRGYDITWQLGYRIGNISGATKEYSEELGQEVSNLHRLIDSHPRYHNTAVLGPDLELCEDPECLQAVKAFLRQANDALDILILQMKPQEDLNRFKSVFEKLNKFSEEIDILSLNKDIRSNKNSWNKNLWVAEAENIEHSGGLRDAMYCALSLGHTSHLGYQTFLLHLPQLSQPSSSYWTALLYRATVGRMVLGTRVWPQETEVAVFAACTVAETLPTLDMEWEYNAGAVTVWGVNSAEESAHISLQAGARLDLVHLYVLTQDGRDKRNILLNGQPLHLVHGVLPRLSPRIRMISRSMSVSVPAQSVFFIILPDFQAPACLINSGGKLPDPPKKEDVAPVVISFPTPTWKLGVKPGDIVFEKGGIFRDASNGLRASLRTETKKNIQERIRAIFKDAEKNNVAKLKQSEKSVNKEKKFEDFSNLNEGNSGKSNQPLVNSEESNPLIPTSTSSSQDFKKYEDLLTSGISTTEQKLPIQNYNEYNPSSEILIQRNYSDKRSSNASSLTYNNTAEINSMAETQFSRVKRSEEYGYFENPTFRDTETSPLYRRVNLLRRILNKMQQPKLQLYVDEKQDRNFQDITGPAKTLQRKYEENKLQPSERYINYADEIPSRRKNYISKEKVTKEVPHKETENINYLPGEFYEILGGLKIDSNVSLKDKEKVLEVSDSLQSQKCNDSTSKLLVTKKPKNDFQEDKKLVEYATEQSKQYYVVKNLTVEQQINTDKPEDRVEEKLKNYKGKYPQTDSNEDKSESGKQKNLNSREILQNPKIKESDDETVQIETPVKRTTRDTIHMEEDVDESPKLFLQNIPNEENYKRSDDLDEVELKRFLEELTIEGEDLLQTIDAEYERNSANTYRETDTKQLLTTEPIPILDKNKTFFNDEKGAIEKKKTGASDFYITNNVLTDREVKPKRKYPTQGEKTMKYFLDKTTNTITDNNMEIKNQLHTTISPVVDLSSFQTDSIEPSLLTTLQGANEMYVRTNSIQESITDNPDKFTASTTPQADKVTKPEVNFTYNTNPGTNTSRNLLFNHMENKSKESFNITSSKISKVINPGVVKKIDNKSFTRKETDQLQENSGGLHESIVIQMNSDNVTATERGSDEQEQLVDRKTTVAVKILSSTSRPNDINIEKIYVVGDLIDDNDKGTETDQQITNPDLFSKSTALLNISDTNNTTVNKDFDKKRKLESQNKNVDKILPSPIKPTLFLKIQPPSIPSVFTLNGNQSLPKKIDIINNRIKEFNSKHKLTTPVLERSSLFSKKYKERLEAIKQRLQKARERLLSISMPRLIPSTMSNNSQKVKREITLNKDISNILFNENKKNQGITQSTETYFNSRVNKGTLKYIQGSQTTYPLSNDLHLIRRFTRQVYNDDKGESTSSMEDNLYQYGSEETKADTKIKSFDKNLTPYYVTAIKKWVVPLSNSTENILYNNKLFPVNLFGIVSDKWVKENIGEVSNRETRRRRRALRYPCVKDGFNDFEAEEENSKLPWGSNVESDKISSVRRTKEIHGYSLTDSGNKFSELILPPKVHSIKSKRAVSQDIERNEMEIKALLTNEIKKERPVNDVSDRENVFSSMLHKTLSKTVTNKTGIERMFELAKEYQKTNPSSLEIFSTKNKQHKNGKHFKEILEKSEEENKAIEVMDDKNLYGSSTVLRKDQPIISDMKLTKKSKDEDVVKNSTNVHKKNPDLNETDVSQKDHKKQKDALSDFIHKIQEFLESVTIVINKAIG